MLKALYEKVRQLFTARLLLSINSENKTRWDLFVMILATYNSFQIPLEVAFNPDSLRSVTLKRLSAVIDFLFFVDIIVSFRTTYINEFNG